MLVGGDGGDEVDSNSGTKSDHNGEVSIDDDEEPLSVFSAMESMQETVEEGNSLLNELQRDDAAA